MLDSKRAQTMRQRLGEKVSGWYESDQYLPKARSVQIRVSTEQWQGLIRLAERANSPAQYFHRLISKERIESSLAYVDRILRRSTEAIAYISKRIATKSSSFICYLADKISDGRYSQADVVAMVDFSATKKDPARYLCGILRRGYVRASS